MENKKEIEIKDSLRKSAMVELTKYENLKI